ANADGDYEFHGCLVAPAAYARHQARVTSVLDLGARTLVFVDTAPNADYADAQTPVALVATDVLSVPPVGLRRPPLAAADDVPRRHVVAVTERDPDVIRLYWQEATSKSGLGGVLMTRDLAWADLQRYAQRLPTA